MKNLLTVFCSIVVTLLITGCGKASTPLEERLWKDPKHCLVFSYEDFGPSVLTYTSLGKPVFTDNGAGGGTKDGKGKIRIIVIVSGYHIAAQRALHDKAGRHEAGFEYRYTCYADALVVIEGVLKEPKLPEADRKKVTATKDKILKEMGDEDHAREVGNALMDEIEAAAKTMDPAVIDKAREFQVNAGPGV